jgi:tRNA A-37 threonylcarbamoyl transferase component Bud32
VRNPIDDLVLVGTPGGPLLDEALKSFAWLRSTPHEARAIQRLLARDAISPLPEPLLLAVASALADRGEPDAAATALQRAGSLQALLMRADLLEAAGDRSAALSLVEQVLGRDVDWPGARERRQRWSAELGRVPPRVARGPDETALAASAPFAPVAPFAPFVLVREAGRGGSGTVYEAEDRELGRRVALKVYHQPERDRAKLLHEARVAVAVAGEGVVPVFDVDPGRGWLAMQWAPLGALAALTSRRRPVRPMAWARALAMALARVHAAGWVHHDVKPANVLLRASGVPMLADFGIARRAGEPSPPGSPGYVSPERLAGRASDPSDDVFAFGRVLLVEADHAGIGADDPWRMLAAECTGPADARPRDGGDLVGRIDAVLGSGGESREPDERR